MRQECTEFESWFILRAKSVYNILRNYYFEFRKGAFFANLSNRASDGVLSYSSIRLLSYLELYRHISKSYICVRSVYLKMVFSMLWAVLRMFFEGFYNVDCSSKGYTDLYRLLQHDLELDLELKLELELLNLNLTLLWNWTWHWKVQVQIV